MTNELDDFDPTAESLDYEPVTQSEVEQFLYAEADMLDEWRLEEWLSLFLPGARYEVPPTDLPDGIANQSLFLIADAPLVLAGRVRRLLRPDAYSEQPRSRTRHFVTNVRILSSERNVTKVSANFLVYRIKNGIQDNFIGRYEHILSKTPGGELRFQMRRAILDQEALRPSGRISIIL